MHEWGPEMAKKVKQPSFDDVLATLRGYKFDVAPSQAVAKPVHAFQISKYGCAAVLVAGTTTPAAALIKPGVVIAGEIGFVLDRGYQKFIKTPSSERAATADQLKALHRFTEELRQATGGVSLYNEAMGTVSNESWYDRVKGRNLPEAERPTPAWELPVAPGTPGEVS